MTTIADDTRREDYVASAAQTIFPYSFAILEADELDVYVDSALQSSALYTVSGADDPAGGNVEFLSAMSGGEAVLINGDKAYERLTDFSTAQKVLLAAELNDELSSIIIQQQQLARDLGRCVRAAIGDVSPDMQLPPVADRKGKYAYFADPSGDIEPAELLASGTTLSQSVIAGYLNPQTPAEVSAGAVIVDYSYEEGHAFRYQENASPLVTDMTLGLQTAINVASYSGRCRWPAGAYLFSQLYLHYDSVNNPNFNPVAAEAGPLIIEGDGAMHTNHITSGVTAGTYLQSSETTNNAVILAAPSGGDTANQGRIHIKNMSFAAATTGYVLQLNEFQDECLLEDVFVYNAGTGGGITMDNYWYSQFRRVLVLGQHIAFYRKPDDCTGIGWRLGTQGGSHTKFEHCSARGFNIPWSVGDSGETTKELTFEHCQSIACNYGWDINEECEGTVLRKCNSELITYRAIRTVGAVEGFRVDGGQYIGVLSEHIDSHTYVENDTCHNDSGNIYICTSGGVAGVGGPTGTGSGISDGGCTWDFVVASAESDFATIELDTDTILPIIEKAKIRVPEGGSGVKLVEDGTMHPQINDNVFGVNFSGVTNGVCINANGSALTGSGVAKRNQNLGAFIDTFDTEDAFNEYSDPVTVVVQKRVRAVAIAATISVGTSHIVKVSGTGTVITALAPVNKGQEVTISIGNSGQTMTHSATLNLAGDVDWLTAAVNESRRFWCDGTNWIQVE